MCGIIGYFKESKNAKVNTEAKIASVLACERGGRDSSGIVTHKIGQDLESIKGVMPISTLVLKHEDDVRRIILNSDIGLVHTRHATIGRIDLHNTQPFIKSPYVFLHNGHINGLGDVDESDSKQLGTILMTRGYKGIRPYMSKGWANIVIYDYLSHDLILSPDPQNSRIWVKHDKGLVMFGSEESWLCCGGRAYQLSRTSQYHVGKSHRIYLNDFRADKELFTPRRYTLDTPYVPYYKKNKFNTLQEYYNDVYGDYESEV